MPIADLLKYDIRVRDRLLRKGQLDDAQIKKHLDALVDQSEKLVELELKQPALQKESERAEYARISRPSPTIARPAPIRPFEDEGDDDLPVPNDLDDDEDLDDEEDDDDDEDEAEVSKDKVEDKPKDKPEDKVEKGETGGTTEDEDDWGEP